MISHHLCLLNPAWVPVFNETFKDHYATCHHLETHQLRSVAKFFGQLLMMDVVSWIVMECIHLNEVETNSSRWENNYRASLIIQIFNPLAGSLSTCYFKNLSISWACQSWRRSWETQSWLQPLRGSCHEITPRTQYLPSITLLWLALVDSCKWLSLAPSPWFANSHVWSSVDWYKNYSINLDPVVEV